ncbi:hypothetical protein HAHE_30200 [Haloferula helveola]|uniref:Uncharacterized protein n=2 Tax=Haloferula helveola TaxID=490095 RepID=A0ABN6H850_9BACT|nr:hypothetical protein HAHE_30200 [Haloferula helveola]
MAAVFCYLYISKPVIRTESSTVEAVPPALSANEGTPALAASVPSGTNLPGDLSDRPAAVAPEAISEASGERFEETNLRIQHVLGATGPAGEPLGKITLDVPVIYESGTVRWTQDDVEQARSLLSRIQDYQNRARSLREEAVVLISEWDDLVIRSIPDESLRADSPTVPENQGVGSADAAPLKSTEAIEIENP